MSAPIRLYTGDEHAQWVATINYGGTLIDYSSGYTFTCVVTDALGTTKVTKTTGITGAGSGVVTVAFTGAEMSAGSVTATANNPGTYWAYLTPRKTADSSDGPTVRETLIMEWRP